MFMSGTSFRILVYVLLVFSVGRAYSTVLMPIQNEACQGCLCVSYAIMLCSHQPKHTHIPCIEIRSVKNGSNKGKVDHLRARKLHELTNHPDFAGAFKTLCRSSSEHANEYCPSVKCNDHVHHTHTLLNAE